MDGLGSELRTHSDTEGEVWDVKPVPNWNLQDARSHTSRGFEVHSDASFEKIPPRFVAMSIVHADKLGGGCLSVSRISEIVKKLDTGHDALVANSSSQMESTGRVQEVRGRDNVCTGADVRLTCSLPA